MPKLQAMPIKTQQHRFFLKLWLLIARKRQWMLLEDWHYVLPNGRNIIIPQGFVFDGNSFPMAVWLFFSPTGLLLIPTIIHDFAFKYDYLWVSDSTNTSKYKAKAGFYFWCNLTRKIGIKRNELAFVDNFIWLLSVMFGRLLWNKYRSINFETVYPESLRTEITLKNKA